ncbi:MULTISPECIES: hypothetical protein [unclassified Mesorhizobium]|uniref:hypothetical protein n=1 Tax=unclassified Mesorhizobium TaxID=325217 RepID=UPI00112EC526|nr:MULTISPECIES: hypothetical protein [unclassified Mesorhizobium]TPJ50627.1 hypothetical protein FJ426_24555 [Mesorhizobium sp. B2-6-4]TPM14021.1 hypothetical protein FJ953_26870 [Mesorhizobium sp. B2-3-6]
MSNSGIDHELSAAADEAAVWLSVNWWKAERPLTPFLRKRFGLSAVEAVHAMRESARIRGLTNEKP